MNKNNYRFNFLIRIGISLFLCIIISLFSSETFGQSGLTQSKKWNIYNFANDAGLQRTNIFQVDFDSSNVVWIATSDGLFKCDGYTYQKFTTADGLPSDFVRTVEAVGKDSVWIGTDNGPAFFDGNEFVTYTNIFPEKNINIRRIYNDTQNTIWFCSDSWPIKNTIGGLAYFKNNEFFADTVFNDKYVVTIFQSKEGTYYLVTDGGIYTGNTNKWKKLDNPLLENGDINWTSAHIIEHPEYGIIISTGDQIFILNKNVLSKLENIPEHKYGIAEYKSSFLIFNMVSSTTGRLKFYSKGKMENVSDDIPVIKGYIEGIATDNENNYWMYGYGLLTRYSPENYEWELFYDTKNPIFVEINNNIYLQNQFLNEKSIHYPEFPTKSELEDITGYNEDSKFVWGNNYFFDLNLDKKFLLPANIVNNKIENIFKIENNIYVIADTKNGKNIFRYINNTWSLVDIPSGFQLLKVNFNFNKSEIYIYFKKNTDGKDYVSTISSISNPIGIPERFTAKFPGHLFIDSQENIYLYNDVGLSRYDAKTRKWDEIGNTIGNAVVKIFEQGKYLWFVCTSSMGGSDGLSRYSLNEQTMVQFRTDIITSYNKSGNGSLLFGSNGKFYVVSNQTENLPFLITLPIDGKINTMAYSGKMYWISMGNDLLKFAPNRANPNTLVSFQNNESQDNENVYIQFEGVRRFIPRNLNNNFKYSIKINNAEWSETSTENQIQINRKTLKPGNNSLEVKSVDAGFNQQIDPSVYNFKLKSIPLEQRPFFIPAVIILISLLSFLGFLAFRSEQKLKKLVDKKTLELTESEKKFRTLYEKMAQGVTYQNRDGYITDANPAALQILGLTLDQMQGKTSFDPDWKSIREDGTDFPGNEHPSIQALKTGKAIHNVVMGVFNTSKEEYRWIKIDAVPQFREGETKPHQVFTTFDDITERKLAEEKLVQTDKEIRKALNEAERSEFLLNEAGRMAKIGAWEFDLATQKTRWSKQVFELHAIPVGEVPDFDYIMGCYVNGSEEILRESIEKCITERKIYELELRFLNARNEKLWVRAIGYPIVNEKNEIISLRGVVQDITELKESILRIEESEKSLKEAVGQLERREFFLNETGRLAKVGGWDLDLETMTPYFSDETYRIYEIPPGKPPKVEDGINLYAPEARPIIQKLVAEAIENQKPYDISVPFISARGTKKWVRTQGQVQLKNNKPIRLYGAIQDITEQKQKEIELKTSEERFRAMIEGAPDPIFIQINKCFSYLNHHAVKLFGAKTENELLGKPVLGFFHPDFHKAALERIKKLNEDKNVVHEPFEQILIQVNGTEIWVETKGEPIVYEGENGGLVFIRDITYRKKAEKELRDSKILLENINNNLPGAVIQYKLFPDGTDALIYVSEGSKEIWGVRPEEAMQNNDMIWEQIDKNYIGDVKKSIEESYQNLTPWNVEFKNNLPDGSEKWIEGIGIPEKQEDGGMVWNSLMLDITERKLAEIKLKEYQKSLKDLTTEISLVEEKQRKEIAENIHDHLSQSLVISKMKLTDLQKELKNPVSKGELKLVIDHISNALENSRKITYDLSPPVLYELGLIETMYWLVEKIEAEYKLKATFITELDVLNLPEQKLILIYRIIQELVNNIVKHANAGKIDISFLSKDEDLEIAVIDDGDGFDVNKLNNASASKGGFGLFAVKERVQNLGGTFAIDTEKGKGTNVKIYIPLKTL